MSGVHVMGALKFAAAFAGPGTNAGLAVRIRPPAYA
jgi:hypothetical protein